MTATELISQHKQIVSRGYFTDNQGNKVKSLTLPEGITVTGNTLNVAGNKLVTVVMSGDTREITYHNTAMFNSLVSKAVANHNKVVTRNANGQYTDADICNDAYGNGTITLIERFKLPAVAQAITLDDLLLFAKSDSGNKSEA
jgi:hypothetical protein